jgi:hypothetical protein
MKIVSSVVVLMCLSAAARAQQPTTAEVNDAVKRLRAEQAAAEKIAAEKAAATRTSDNRMTPVRRQPVNVKVEFTLTEQRDGSAPNKRTVSAIVSDGGVGQIRSQSQVSQIGFVPLNIDTNPELTPEGKIRLSFSLQYDIPTSSTEADRDARAPRGTVMTTSLHESASLVLESGTPMMAAQSADPVGDRRVTLEVKATILK